jgi:hypothetical protein
MIAHVAPGTKRKTGEIGQSEKERKREEGKSKGEIKDCHGRIC